MVMDFLLKYKAIILFYAVIIILLYLKRKRLDFQAKVIVLYRMKWGIKWMDKYSSKFREWVVLLGYIGTGVGFIGMLTIMYVLIKNLVDLVLKPAATSGVALVLPGTEIPGLGILPFWHWLIAIFLIALVHEFSHGIVARAHNIKVKNTGLVLFGPIIGAFVEPDEKKMRKESDIVQYSILAAGAFANILLAIAAILLLSFVTAPLQQTMIEPTGFSFASYVENGLPAETAGIPVNVIVYSIDGKEVTDFESFSEVLYTKKPGDQIMVGTVENEYPLTLIDNPDSPGKPFLGIYNIKNEFDVKEQYQSGIGSVAFFTLEKLNGFQQPNHGFLKWLFLLSLGIGLFNLLPLPIVDGGRMAQVFLYKLQGAERGEKNYRRIGMFFLVILLFLLGLSFF
ncbi:hypothetical protein COV20_04650 [Candidatus Woesearchaeota archaeon CG10_big_fil_rev_8_21_14_0_10_45_16]|nr:MAG: hypothetical protein COV20_04650 [Candidatus Woesearchaeota archaeon CG10_big_fil_rev_8_21_14_0_10_45_16]